MGGASMRAHLVCDGADKVAGGTEQRILVSLAVRPTGVRLRRRRPRRKRERKGGCPVHAAWLLLLQ